MITVINGEKEKGKERNGKRKISNAALLLVESRNRVSKKTSLDPNERLTAVLLFTSSIISRLAERLEI